MFFGDRGNSINWLYIENVILGEVNICYEKVLYDMEKNRWLVEIDLCIIGSCMDG